jgi:putative phosphoribosyl transferase
MREVFRDRAEAGRLLAERLVVYADQREVLVLGLPRGGVPVAFEVANRLHAPLDVFVVRKLGVPGHEEYAFGAIASGGVCFFDEGVVKELQISQALIDKIVAREGREVQRRELAYRGHEAPPTIQGKIALLIDDGIATGSTMIAAARAVRLRQPRRLIIAVPTAPPSSCARLAAEADEVIALIKPADFFAVGQWYIDFRQTSDEEVRDLLVKAGHQPARAA